MRIIFSLLVLISLFVDAGFAQNTMKIYVPKLSAPYFFYENENEVNGFVPSLLNELLQNPLEFAKYSDSILKKEAFPKVSGLFPSRILLIIMCLYAPIRQSNHYPICITAKSLYLKMICHTGFYMATKPLLF